MRVEQACWSIAENIEQYEEVIRKKLSKAEKAAKDEKVR